MYWMIVLGILLFCFSGILLSIFLGCKNHVGGWQSAGYGFYLAKQWCYQRLGLKESEDTKYQALYVNQKPEEIQKREDCRQGLLMWGILAAVGVLIGILGHGGYFDRKEVSRIMRPDEGVRIKQILVETPEDVCEVELRVPEKKWTEEEIERYWTDAKQQLSTWILGENKSLEEVTKPLRLINRVPQTPITVNWLSSDYSLVNYEGDVRTEEVKTPTEVVLTAEVRYGEWKDSMTIPVIVCQKENQDDNFRETVAGALTESLNSQGYDAEVELPASIQDMSVQYYEKPAVSPGIFLGLAVVLMITVFSAGLSEQKKKLKKRAQQIQKDYPEIVSKLTLLLEAGMTIRHAWERIVLDYIRYGRRGKERRYAYEEMIKTRNQLQVGMPENKAYAQFGRRCGSIVYLRFSSVLVQNLEKGTKSIVPLLKKEADEALYERREHARQLGEEAGTKLLFPMAGMLIIVLAIVMIPAFMSF